MQTSTIPLYFFVIRHGETDWNLEKRMQGREDIPLNETGRRQSRELAKVLASVPFSYIVTSPLSRAMDVAVDIASYHPNARIIPEPLLLERDKGNVSGFTPVDRDFFLKNGGHEEMEPVASVRERAARSMEACHALAREAYASRAEASGRPVYIAIVTHGGLIYHLLESISEGALESATGRVFLHNCDVTVINEQNEILAFDLTVETFPQFWEALSGKKDSTCC
ncbi:MAG: histidine phosphatase family protein [Firmicutes bacterium]|nr:histidine phosphatase family protein [Bacillota bacterium]